MSETPWRRAEIARNADEGLRVAKEAESNSRLLTTRLSDLEHRVASLERSRNALEARVANVAGCVRELAQRCTGELGEDQVRQVMMANLDMLNSVFHLVEREVQKSYPHLHLEHPTLAAETLVVMHTMERLMGAINVWATEHVPDWDGLKL